MKVNINKQVQKVEPKRAYNNIIRGLLHQFTLDQRDMVIRFSCLMIRGAVARIHHFE